MTTAQTRPTPHDRTPSRATPPRRRARRLLIGLLVIAVAVLVWPGPRRTDTRAQRFDTGVEQLIIDVNGRVTITAADLTAVTLTREWGWFGPPDATLDLDDDGSRAGTVVVASSRCGPQRFLPGRCRTHATATVTPDTTLTVTTSAGAITVTGARAGVDLTTSAGRIDVTDIAGPTRLRSSAGAITGSISTSDVDVTTSAGPITLDVAGDLQHLSATSSAGAVDLTVPDRPYQIDLVTNAGDVDFDVRTDPDATRTITARSGAGDITIRRTRP